MKVRVCFHKRRQTACPIKAYCFVGKADRRETILKCEVMRRVLNIFRQNICQCKTRTDAHNVFYCKYTQEQWGD